MKKDPEKATSMERAYRRIREKIMAGELLPGTPLREEHIARELGVSATPVREALRRLANEGCVSSAPYRGSFIREFSEKELDDLFRLREVLEGLAVRLAAENASSGELAQVKAAVDAEAAYIGEAEKAGLSELLPSFEQEIAFHAAVASVCGSARLAEQLETVKTQLACVFLLDRGPVPLIRLRRVNLQHRMIGEAVSLRWGDAAEGLMRCHLREGRARLAALRRGKTAGEEPL